MNSDFIQGYIFEISNTNIHIRNGVMLVENGGLKVMVFGTSAHKFCLEVFLTEISIKQLHIYL